MDDQPFREPQRRNTEAATEALDHLDRSRGAAKNNEDRDDEAQREWKFSEHIFPLLKDFASFLSHLIRLLSCPLRGCVSCTLPLPCVPSR
jgi:hypothetical protein